VQRLLSTMIVAGAFGGMVTSSASPSVGRSLELVGTPVVTESSVPTSGAPGRQLSVVYRLNRAAPRRGSNGTVYTGAGVGAFGLLRSPDSDSRRSRKDGFGGLSIRVPGRFCYVQTIAFFSEATFPHALGKHLPVRIYVRGRPRALRATAKVRALHDPHGTAETDQTAARIGCQVK
jgi:hypothetical protein